jgi:hypothetical protein
LRKERKKKLADAHRHPQEAHNLLAYVLRLLHRREVPEDDKKGAKTQGNMVLRLEMYVLSKKMKNAPGTN